MLEEYLSLNGSGQGLIITGIMFGAGFFLGGLLMWLRKQRRIDELESRLLLEARLNEERHDTLERTFAGLSAEALRRNNRDFLELAHQVLGRYQAQAKGDLDLKQQAVGALVTPIREALEKTEQQLHQLERERRESHGALNRHLKDLTQSQHALRDETRSLVQALKRPEVRGQWGELTLRRLTELAGMVEHCDFSEQVHTQSELGAGRPDMVIHLPAGRQVVVDVKTPLDAYLRAVESTDRQSEKKFLRQHAQHVRQRVRELAAKAYWRQFSKAPEFVILFIPGDQFLSSALELDPDLLEEALARQVILATPTSFVALLRAVAYGWRQENLNKNAERIREIGESLFHRIATLSRHLAKLGRHIEDSVVQYNRLVGSFDSQVMPGARKFTELGVASKKECDRTQKIDTAARQPNTTE